MKSKAILMALLAFAFGAQAVPVDVEDAKKAARAWAYRGATLGARIGDTVERAATHRTANDVTFYAIKMKGGGTVFMSSDTEDTPVILFTQESGDFANIDKASPLWALLNRDAEVRQALRAKQAVKRASAAAGGAASVTLSANEKLWDELVSFGTAMADPSIKLPSRTHVSNPGDVRVSPLVKSKWDQSTVGSKNVYNYYTPMLSVRPGYSDGGKRAVCGCVATAMSQVMRYHQFPSGSITPVTRECTVEAKEIRTTEANKDLTMQGGVYDWANMPLVPTSSISDGECKAIGKLTSDAGISVYMNYDYSQSGGSGSFMPNAAEALRTVFGFKSAAWYSADEISDDMTMVKEGMLSNFDAGYPVLMGISGDGGHAIVGDGYGFNSDKLYVHLNMGWSGSQDTWYNLPDIDTSYYHFTVFDDIVFNIFPDANGATVSGLTVDAEGSRMDKVTVIATQNGAEVARTVSNKGVWGLKLPSGTYNLEAKSEDGAFSGVTNSVTVSSALTRDYGFNGIITDISWTKHYSVQRVSSFENVWGADIKLEEVAFEDSVKNLNTGVLYGSLDNALADAGNGHILEILSQTMLRDPQAITRDVTIRTVAGADLEEVFVICRDRARNGFTNVTAKLSLENVKFRNTKGCFVNVAAGGTLTLSGRIGIDGGVDGDTFIQTVDKGGLVLAGALSADSFITVDCVGAKTRNEAFGTFTCDDASAEASAAHFLNPYDPELGGVAKTDGSKQLVWDNVPVDPGRAIAYYTGGGGASGEYYLTLHKIFAEHTSGEVVILRDCVETDTKDNRLKGPVEITGAMRILSTNEPAATVAFSNDISIVIADGGSLSVSNLVFTGAVGEGAFVMNGGKLTLESGTVIEDCDNEMDLGDLSGAGAVTVLGGTLTMRSGVTIRNCVTAYGCGGGVYVESYLDNALFEMKGGSIENCLSAGYGGGAYVSDGAHMTLSGDATLVDSISEIVEGRSDNLYLAATGEFDLRDLGLSLAGELTGLVYLRCGGEDRADNDEPFALIADACSLQAASNSAAYFRSDDDPETWHGAVGEDGATLVWSDEIVPIPQPPLEYPVAWVIYAQDDGTSITNEFSSLDEALQSIQDDATVVVNAVWFPDDPAYGYELPEAQIAQITNSVPYLTTAVTIRNNVVIKTEDTDDGFINTICRKENVFVTVAEGGSLTLTNICFEGMFPEFEVVTNNVPAPLLHCKGWQIGGDDAMIRVLAGGELVMAEGSGIYDVVGSARRDSCAVSVENGTFIMADDAEIAYCENTWKDDQNLQKSPAGGVIVSGPDAKFSLQGGTISYCTALTGGGALVENSAQMEISGNSLIIDNYLTDEEIRADLSVSREATDGQTGELVLVDEFTGWIGILEPRLYDANTEAASVDTNVFGRVAEGLDLPALRPSAANFFRNAAPDVTGLIVTNDTEALLVWTSAVDEDGVYRDKDGNEYKVVGDPTPTEIDPPTAVTGLIYNGNEQTGVVAADGYTVTDNVKINAGDYTATVTLKDGYVWTGGSTDPLQIGWSIAKATYDMSGVTFTSASFEADGSPKSIYISGDLPAGVSVSYEGNGQTAPGSYTVTAKFTGDAVNYEPIADKTATLTITKKEDPDPEYTVTTNDPSMTPLAFSNIVRIAETEWSLSLTNLLKDAEYALSFTDDLTTPFTTGAWFRAESSGLWTTNWLFKSGEAKPAYFWRAHGRTTYVTNWLNAVSPQPQP